MKIQKRIDEVSKQIQELSAQKENLDFLKENNLGVLLDKADEIESTNEVLQGVIEKVIEKQLEKDPKQMNDSEKEVWVASTLSRMITINQMMSNLVLEIDKMRKA